ncbi:MAG TPA: phosphatase PAP2 family protein [Gemmatimonadaceae bacterium]|nr:phosphatase PAP2 family protein [Gemmatimonadaceae bacterium]
MQRRSHRTRALALLGAGLAAAGAFAAVAAAVMKKKTAYRDGRGRRALPKRRRRVTKMVAAAVGPLGKPYVHGPAALAIGALLWSRGSRAGAGAMVLSSVASGALSKVFDHALPHRSPPPGRHSPSTPSFPSGHSLETAAVSLAAAYLLTRERVGHPLVVVPAALTVPLSSGIGRLYLDRHWVTDILAGWLGGITVAALSAAVYEAGSA